MKKNLVILTKFEREDIAEPTEQHTFCNGHYEEKKKDYTDFQLTRHRSSMPNSWCEICTPADYGY